MALDERYIVASDLEQYFVDKDSGLPLAGGTLTFYRDAARNVPKQVFQLSGAPPNYTYTSMGAQITLSSVGTVQNSGGDNEVIYYYPYDADGNLDLYYVVCESSGSIQQFTREAWPNLTAVNVLDLNQAQSQNQISNPQFTNVLINQGIPTVLTVSSAMNQVFEFAPNWEFIISGTGDVTIQQIPVIGNDNIPTSPPYMLDINIDNSITSCLLRQRFPANSGLWSSTNNELIFLSGSYIAKNQGVGTTGVQMLYSESSGGMPIIVVDGTFDNSMYWTVSGSTTSPIPQSNNTDSGSNGYIDIYLSFNSGSHVRISSIQVVPTINNQIDVVPYNLNSSNREEALLGDYYLPRLIQKRISSFVLGWDFPTNPYQYGASGNIVPNAAYIANQTIAAKSSAGTVAWSKDAVTQGLKFVTNDNNDSLLLLQYLTGGQVKNMLGSRLSVNVFGYKDPGSTGGAVVMKVYLFRGSSAATIPALPATLGTLNPNGSYTLTAANWTEIQRSGLPTAQATLSTYVTNADINNGANDYGFSGWEITDSTQIGDTDKFAIAVTLEYPAAPSNITINSISVIPDDLPCRPAINNPITYAIKHGSQNGTSYTSSSVPFVDIDNVNLVYTTFIPIGFILRVSAVAPADTQGGVSNYNLGIFDSVANAIIGGSLIQADNSRINMNSCIAAITGDGLVHTISLQWSNNGATGRLANISISETPAIDFLLIPCA